MGYAILRTSKIKSAKDIVQRYNHDYRIYRVANADPSVTTNIYDAVDTLNGRSYLDIYEDTVRELRMEGAIDRAVRSDAVKGIDVFLSFSREDRERINLDEWVRANVAWLRKEFNPPEQMITYTDPETGEERQRQIDNVKSVVVHMDEETPHIHAFIVPIDERGHLNAKRYMSDRQSLVDRQDRYAMEMEAFGLDRGERHSVATHIQRSEFYARMLNAVEAQLPSPIPGESAMEYRERANDVYRTQQSNHLEELFEKDREIVVAKSSVYEERERLEAERLELEKRDRELSRKEEKWKDAIGEDTSDPAFERELRRQIRAHRQFTQAIEEHPDREMADRMKAEYEEMIAWQRRREARHRGQMPDRNGD